MISGYSLLIASNVQRDTMAIELHHEDLGIIAEVFEYETGERKFSAYEEGIDVALIEWLLASARVRL